MPRSVKDTERPKKVRFNSAPKGVRPSVQITPPDAPVRVAISSLEAQVGYGSLVRQLNDSYIRRVAFFRSKEGGGLSFEEARAQACDYCEDEGEAKEIFSEVMSQPVADIRFIDLARIWVLTRILQRLCGNWSKQRVAKNSKAVTLRATT